MNATITTPFIFAGHPPGESQASQVLAQIEAEFEEIGFRLLELDRLRKFWRAQKLRHPRRSHRKAVTK